MIILKKIVLFLVLIVLFNGCNFLNNLTTPSSSIIDKSIPSVKYSSIKSIPDITSIAFEWEKVDNHKVVGYNFYRTKLNKQSKNLKLVKTVDNRYTTHYLDTNLEPNTKYAYQISAKTKDGKESETTKAYIVKTLPKIPALSFIQAISNLPNRIKISWRPQQDQRVEYYKIERYNNTINDWENIKTINGRLQSEYIDTNLDNNETFKYKVTSYTFDNIPSIPSKIVEATTKKVPFSVQNLTISTNLPKQIKLSWQPSPSKDVVKYIIYRSPFKILGYIKKYELDSNKLTFTDKIKENGKDYYYKIFAVDKDGLKSASNEAIRGTTLSKPAQPIITQGQIIGNQVILNWIPGDNRTISYNVYKRVKKSLFDSKTFKFTNIKALKFEDTNLVNDVEYFYTVQAIDKNGIVSDKTDEINLNLPKIK